jgi:hypothetical protein
MPQDGIIVIRNPRLRLEHASCYAYYIDAHMQFVHRINLNQAVLGRIYDAYFLRILNSAW